MSLRSILVNDELIALMQSALQKNRMSHAYLFTGPSGVGKKFSARQIAKFFNCKHLVRDEQDNIIDACDICSSCHKIANGNHPDINYVEKIDDAASIKIDQIKKMQDFLFRKPYEGNIKIACIFEADTMTVDAQNALLKILEEPPKDSLIILSAGSSNGVLRTVVSRCQVVRFLKLSFEKLQVILERHFDVDSAHSSFLARLGDGCIGKALEMDDKRYLQWRDQVIRESLKDPFLESLKVDKIKRNKQKEVLRILELFYRDILMFKFTNNKNIVVNIDYIDTIELLAFSHDLETLHDAVEAIGKLKNYIERNVNAKIAFGVLAKTLDKCSVY